jgi:integrase
MGHVFKPQVTMAIPPGAQVVKRAGQRIARWRNAHGKLCTGEVRTTARGDRISFRSGRYLARYRDADGITQTVATGCRDESAARTVLVELERRTELVRAGVVTPAQDAVANHKRATIAGHVDAYVASLRARGNTPKHCDTVKRLLNTLIAGCRLRTLGDVCREPVERWLNGPDNAKRSARTKNTYRNAAVWFCNWAVDVERLVANPLARLPRFNEQVDRRRQPRALTPDEITRLLDAALRRPLQEALKFNKGWRKNQLGQRLRPETRAKLERLGMERALAYKTMVLTGLRLGELSSVRVSDVRDTYIELDARDAKNRTSATIPLRPDLTRELRGWIGDRRDGLLFRLSINLVKVFNRDLAFAGIPKRDERNRTACVHSLRHTFATLMSRGGVAPRTAQAAMRHSTIDLTMSVYTDPKLLDVASALNALPDLPLPAPSGGVPPVQTVAGAAAGS